MVRENFGYLNYTGRLTVATDWHFPSRGEPNMEPRSQSATHLAQKFSASVAILFLAGCVALVPSGQSEPELTPEEAWATLPTPEFVARAEKVWALAAPERSQCEEATPARTAEVVRRHWGTPDTQMVAMLCRRIWRGMTAAQLRFSWGEPTTVNRSVGSWGTHEQWVYRSYYGYSASYVYVEDGKVTSYQTSGQ